MDGVEGAIEGLCCVVVTRRACGVNKRFKWSALRARRLTLPDSTKVYNGSCNVEDCGEERMSARSLIQISLRFALTKTSSIE